MPKWPFISREAMKASDDGAGKALDLGIEERICECLNRISEAEGALFQARGALSGIVEINGRDRGLNERMMTFGNGPTFSSQMADCASPSVSALQSAPQSAVASGRRIAVREEPSTRDAADPDEDDDLETRAVFLDQILLDDRPEASSSHMADESVDANHNGGPPNKKKGAKGKKGAPMTDKEVTQTVMVHAGKDPVTGKPRAIWVDRNRPIMVNCCCGPLKVPIWHPESDLRVVWGLVGFLFIVFEAFLIPFTIAFAYVPSGTPMKVITVVNTYFILDVCFSFLTGFNDFGTTIMDPGPIAHRYACTWLTPDVLSAIPWEWIPEEHGPLATTTKCFRFFKGMRLLRIARLLRLMRMGVFTDALEIVIESNRFFMFLFGVLRVLFLLFGITHWTACAWYIVGSTPSPDEKTTWINKFIGDIDDLSTRYFYSVYFALTTMTTVGYGDIVAQNYTEVKFVLLLLLVASIVFAGLMGALTDLICNLNSEGNARQERKVMLSRYMRWRAVPKDLFMSVREHLIFLWDTNEGYGEFEGLIKEQLPPTLKRELCYHIFGRILRSAPFLAWMRGCDVCMKELSQAVESIFLSKGDHLFHVGQANEHIYVLLKGTLHISQNEKLSLTPGDTGPEDPHLSGTTGFSIPRNKEANIADVVKMMFKGAHAKEKHKEKEKKQEVLATLTLSLAPAPGDSDQENDEKQEDKPSADILESHVDSKLLHSAFNKLNKRDLREKRSACYIQRRWKRKKASAQICQEKSGKRLSAAKSKFVHAPAYLGESCLWAPLADWGTTPPPRYPYTACCETRGEFVYIPRDAVKDIIDRFSPWLADRFEYFRVSVVKNMNSANQADDSMGPYSSPGGTADGPPSVPPLSLSTAEAAPAAGAGDPGHPSQLPPTLEHSTVYAPPPMMNTYSADDGQPAHPGRPNYEAMAAMNYSVMGSSVGSPMGFAMPHMKPGTRSNRSFRAAAAAAVARVSAVVTPPSALPTPRATPRATTPPHRTPIGTPRNEWGYPSGGPGYGAASGRHHYNDGVNHAVDRSGNALSEPLLPNSRSPGQP